MTAATWPATYAPVRPILPTFLALACGAAGGAAFLVLGLPAPWVAGPMAAVAVAALAGAPVAMPGPLRSAGFAVVGAAMGAAVTPETLRQLTTWPVSLTLLALSIISTIALVSWHLRRFHRWDAATARYTAIPGALTSTLILAATSSADVPRVAFAQSLRLLVLVALVPPVLGNGASGVAVAPAWTWPSSAAAAEILLVLIGVVAFIAAARLLRVPAPALVGGMIGSAVVHAGGWVTAPIPEPVLLAAFVISGAVIGERFKGATLTVAVTSLRASVESVVIAISLSIAFAWLGTVLTGLPFGQLWLAMAPGGLETMAILAFVLELDATFVGAHHIMRFVALSLLIPLWPVPRQDRAVSRRQP